MGRMSVDKGYRANLAVVRYLNANGFPHAVIRSKGLGGADIDELGPGLEIEVKNRERWDLSGWLDQLAEAMAASDAEQGAVVVKRKGTTDVASWWFVQTMRIANRLHGEVGWVMSTMEAPHFRAADVASRYQNTAEVTQDGAVPWVAYRRPGREWLEQYAITTVGHGVRLLRAAGWGTPLEVDA